MKSNTRKTIPVFGPTEVPKNTIALDTLSVTDVPVEAIKANMERVLRDTTEILENIKDKLGKGKIDHVELNLGISIDGSVGLLGSGVSAGAEASIKVQIKFE